MIIVLIVHNAMPRCSTARQTNTVRPSPTCCSLMHSWQGRAVSECSLTSISTRRLRGRRGLFVAVEIRRVNNILNILPTSFCLCLHHPVDGACWTANTRRNQLKSSISELWTFVTQQQRCSTPSMKTWPDCEFSLIRLQYIAYYSVVSCNWT